MYDLVYYNFIQKYFKISAIKLKLYVFCGKLNQKMNKLVVKKKGSKYKKKV